MQVPRLACCVFVGGTVGAAIGPEVVASRARFRRWGQPSLGILNAAPVAASSSMRITTASIRASSVERANVLAQIGAVLLCVVVLAVMAIRGC